MSGKDCRFVRQRIEFLADGVEELLVIPSGKIGSTNAAIKQGISGKKKGFRTQIKAN
jgi:hypothetical protein